MANAKDTSSATPLAKDRRPKVLVWCDAGVAYAEYDYDNVVVEIVDLDEETDSDAKLRELRKLGFPVPDSLLD